MFKQGWWLAAGPELGRYFNRIAWDRPVPRLTLLFFGATKDVSGSSRNGHRRDSPFTPFRVARQRPNQPPLT